MTAVKRALPFQGMTLAGLQNLALLAIAVCYLAQFGIELYWHNLCGHLAIDYCALWSAGRVANVHGYASIYDLSILGQVESSITPHSSTYAFSVSPIAYLPVFVVPFQLLAVLSPAASYWVWGIGNLLALGLYLRFFIRRTSASQMSPSLMMLTLLSLPVYWNLFNGQVNVWLVICVGETLRAGLEARPFRAGLWLGGLLLKPQLLFLIVPILLVQRAFKMLGGMAASGAALLGVSWLMVGGSGLGHLAQLWLGFVKGVPTNDVAIMMNWRMAGAAASTVGGSLLGWAVTLLGLTMTVLGVLYLWRHRIDPPSSGSVVAWLGLLAATTVFAWHSHVHMAMILLPPLLFLAVNNLLDQKVLVAWAILPAAGYFAAFLAAALIQAGLLPASAAPLTDFVRGGVAFGLSIFLLGWAIGHTDSTTSHSAAQANAAD